jgi:hypothetical protein
MKQTAAVVFAALSIAAAFASPSQARFRVGGCFARGGRAIFLSEIELVP